jgi:hypothetical protein
MCSSSHQLIIEDAPNHLWRKKFPHTICQMCFLLPAKDQNQYSNNVWKASKEEQIERNI